MDTLRVNGRWDTFVPYLRDRIPFNTHGALKGRDCLYGSGGQLPESEFIKLNTLLRTDRLAYVVYSYATPIAWCDVDGAWTVPDCKYSVTTSRHQGRIRAALSSVPR